MGAASRLTRRVTTSLGLAALLARVGRGQNLTDAAGLALGEFTGYATEYGSKADGHDPNVPSFGLVSGACGYGELDKNLWPYWSATAISTANPIVKAGSTMRLGCGACIRVTCTGGGCKSAGASLTVLVTDSCSNCPETQINMHAHNYEQTLATMGKVDVKFQQVPCNPDGGLIVKVTEFKAPLATLSAGLDSGGSFIKLVLLGVPGTGKVNSVSLRGQGGRNWLALENAYGAVWQAGNAPPPPYDLRYEEGGVFHILPGVIPIGKVGNFLAGNNTLSSAQAPLPAADTAPAIPAAAAGPGGALASAPPPDFPASAAAPSFPLGNANSLTNETVQGRPWQRQPHPPSGLPGLNFTAAEFVRSAPGAIQQRGSGGGIQVTPGSTGGLVSWMGGGGSPPAGPPSAADMAAPPPSPGGGGAAPAGAVAGSPTAAAGK